MPIVTATPRGQRNGQVLTEFIDSVGTTSVTYTYPKTQEWIAVRSTGTNAITVTVGGTSQTIQPGQKWENTADFTSFNIISTNGVQSFEAVADEKGSVFDSPEGQYLGGTLGKIAQTVPGKNIFNPSTRTTGVYVDNTSGNFVVSASYDTSDYIAVTPSQIYAVSGFRKLAFYNASKVYISGVDSPNRVSQTVIAPANAYYLRVAFLTTTILTSAQVEVGSVQTTYQPYGTVDYRLSNQVQVSGILNDLTVTKSGELFDITSDIDGGRTITLETDRSGSKNGLFNFLQTTFGSDLIHVTSDDITPIRTFATLGANHGYTCIVIITMAGHSKTTADLGSQWTDGTTAYTLLAISGNDLTFGCPYTVTNGVVTANPVNPVANLTHVSGATNTGVVNRTTLVAGPQLFPSINNKETKYVLDGKEITQDGTYFGKQLQVVESYNVMGYKDIIDYAQTHIGTSYNNESIAGVVRLSAVYTITRGGKCLISHNFKALQKVTILNCGFLQSVIMTLTGHTVKRYMPHVLLKSGFDFKTLVDMTSYNTSLLFGAADYVTAGKPPNRHVDWMYDGLGNKKVGFTMGYIVDKTNSKNADRAANTTNGWDLRNSKKSYPVAMGDITLNPGDYKTFLGYRNYLAPSEVGTATNLNVVKDGKDTYVYIDYHTTVSGANVKLPNDIGKTIVILDSENFTLLNDTVDSDGVTFNITLGYGWAILKCN